MCSPTIVFIILKISHVFSSKIARKLFSVWRIFCKMCLSDFKTGCTITYPHPHPVHYTNTSGFWPRVRARALRAPVFLISLPPQTGAARPPLHPWQLRCFLFIPQKQNDSLQAQIRAARGVYLSTGHRGQNNIPRPPPPVPPIAPF
jgi:hypothetical protein